MAERVLFVAPTAYFADRGCHVRIMGLGKALSALNYDVDMLTYHIGTDMGPFNQIYRIRGLRWYKDPGPGPKRGKVLLDLQILQKVKGLISKGDYTHVYAFLNEGLAVMKLLRANLPSGVRVLGDVQGSLAGEMMQHGRRFRAFWSRLEQWTLNVPFTLTTSSDALTHRVKSLCSGCEPVTLLDGVDTDHFTPHRHEARARAKGRLGLDAEALVFGYLGGLGPGKGVMEVLRAFRNILQRADKDHIKKVHLLMGGYPGAEALSNTAAEMGIGPYVTVKGRVPYTLAPDFLAACDVAIAPKTHMVGEGAQGKILTYMAMALPVIAPKNSYSIALLGNNGLYFDTHKMSLAEVMAMALTMDELDVLGQELRRRVLKYHRWENRADIIAPLLT